MKGEPLIKIDGWCLVSADAVDDDKKDVLGGQSFSSFMWHDCDALKFEYLDEETAGESEIRYLDEEDSQTGKCWYCMERAPNDIYTIWTIHNMSIIASLIDPMDEAWEAKYVENRIKDIEACKKSARKAGTYDG